jgi:hypothetical protein
MKEYILKPILTPQTVSLTTSFDKPATLKIFPPRQPLPTAIIDPTKPLLKLGLDVHLEFIMTVAQKDHANPHAPRKCTRELLVAQVKKWVAEGFQVFGVQESCGFGFVLHRELLAAGTQSFLITPIALNGQRKTDKLDARALCPRPVPAPCACPAGSMATATNSRPPASPAKPSSASAKAPAKPRRNETRRENKTGSHHLTGAA